MVRLDDGDEIAARTVVIATGARYRKLDVPRIDEFEGASVYYAATLMEAQLCTGDPVAVVGGGNSAGPGDRCSWPYALRGCHLDRARGRLSAEYMSRYLPTGSSATPRVEVHLHTEVRELVGEQGILEARRGRGQPRPASGAAARRDAVRVHRRAAVHAPGLAGTAGARRPAASCSPVPTPAAAPSSASGGQPLPLETSRPGVFAVGDVRSGSVKRVASAVGEGAMAVRLAHEHLSAPATTGADRRQVRR